MELYRAGKTLYIEASGDEATEGEWWFDQTISRVVRHNTDTDYVCIAEREPKAPTIRAWMSPATYEEEQRLCNMWVLTFKHNNVVTHETIDLPVNGHQYTMRERIRFSM